MPLRDPSLWMWAEARNALDRIERLHRRFFEPTVSARRLCWEPPADVFETGDGLFIEMALPGVDPDLIEATFEGAALTVVCERKFPRLSGSMVIQRLEIPYGRFERRIPLPAGRYKLDRKEMLNGCLVIWLHKLG